MSFGPVPFALAFDAILGEPGWAWSRVGHPVTWMGNLIDRLDGRLNRGRRADGVVALLVLVTVFGGVAVVIDALIADGPIGLLIEAALGSTLIAYRSLVQHVRAVVRADGLSDARRAVGMIVGRDTSAMDEGAISRAALESLGENWSDGVVAPAFWFAVAGLPGIVIYKAINTADSMIGHRTPRYEAFGWAAARTDDAVNFIPARLAAVTVALAHPRVFRRWETVTAGARAHVSPNAGWPEAALAVATGVELGGPRQYGGRSVDGVRLNAGGREARRGDIRRGVEIIGRAALIHGAVYALLALAL
ncbi:adenosylcobinamide-phosphate synthase CbiB [Acuticoccus sediminis]|uniref:adenosylcobinamide-phosphate synthase CbiB n=1 Tax=Acuticoccus sediminis TaxID=2184697 RepID=UPI001CFE8E0A|nr:adenosylcobinamide-phosphate synthase CbiB [Acuticoccus sediminis]